MKFYNQTYEELFKEIFGDLAKKNTLEIQKKDEDTMSLVSKSYILTIGIYIAGTNILYIDLKHKKVYDLSDYIAISTTDKDREGYYPQEIIADVVDTSLRIRNNSLQNNFSDLLMGNDNWFSDYKKSDYFWEKPYRPQILL